MASLVDQQIFRQARSRARHEFVVVPIRRCHQTHLRINLYLASAKKALAAMIRHQLSEPNTSTVSVLMLRQMLRRGCTPSGHIRRHAPAIAI